MRFGTDKNILKLEFCVFVLYSNNYLFEYRISDTNFLRLYLQKKIKKLQIACHITKNFESSFPLSRFIKVILSFNSFFFISEAITN